MNIRKEIYIESLPERVFDALTDSDEIVNFFPLSEVISDWVVGAPVLYKGEVNGVKFTDFGVIESLSRPKQYKYSYWSDNHGTERLPENHVTISYDCHACGSGTMLAVEQHNIPSQELYELVETQVWDFLLSSLKNYVETCTYQNNRADM